MLSLLRTIWQADSGFPSGSFAFSYGIEGALAQRGAIDAAALLEMIGAILRQRWAQCDRIVLLRASQAGGDVHTLAAIDRDVECSTFGETLRDGSRRNGGAFLASHARLGDELALRLRDAVRAHTCLGHIAVMQGAVWHALGLDERQIQLASAYAVAAGASAAAVRLGAIGALDGQRVLAGCLPQIDQLTAQPVAADAELSSFMPFLEISAARHARADLRLFAN